MAVLNLDTNCAAGTFNLPTARDGSGVSVITDQAILPKCIKLANAAERWNGVMAGWTTGGDG